MSEYQKINPATGLLVTNGIDSAGYPDGSGSDLYASDWINGGEIDNEAFEALPLWLRLAHYAALASVFAFIFWMMFERGIL